MAVTITGKPSSLHCGPNMHFVADYGATSGVIYFRSFSNFCRSSSSRFRCVFSHDLSFENSSVISLTNESRKGDRGRRANCNGFPFLIGCSHRMTVWSSLFIGLFQQAKIYFSILWCHWGRSRCRSRNQKGRAYDLVKTAFRFRLRLHRLRSAYDLVKTRLSESEAEAEELNQSQSVGTCTMISLSFRFCFRLTQSGFHYSMSGT